MLGDNPAVPADHDPVGIDVNFDRRPTALAFTEYLLLSNRKAVAVAQSCVDLCAAGLRHRGLRGVEIVEPAAIGDEPRPHLLEGLPDRPIRPFGMGIGFCPGQRPVEQPGVEFVATSEPHTGREEPLPNQPDLALDLPLLESPTQTSLRSLRKLDCGVQATGSTRWCEQGSIFHAGSQRIEVQRPNEEERKVETPCALSAHGRRQYIGIYRLSVQCTIGATEKRAVGSRHDAHVGKIGRPVAAPARQRRDPRAADIG